MKMNIKRLLCAVILLLALALCACAKGGEVITKLTNDAVKMTAYVYETKLPEGERFCLSLIESDEELNMNEAPNVYKSEHLFEIAWDGNNLKVKLNEKDKSVVEMKVIKDIIVSFGDSKGIEQDGIKREEKSPDGKKTAYLYLKTTDGKQEYCLSLLDTGVAPDMNKEPNVYKSAYEFSFEWSEDMLCVMQNAKDTAKNDVMILDNVMIAFGSLAGESVPLEPSENAGEGIIKEESNGKGKTAYLYIKTVNEKQMYCLSLLNDGEEPDGSKEPNVYKSEFEFDFMWSDGMLLVNQNKDDKTVNDIKTIDDIMVVFGTETSLQ